MLEHCIIIVIIIIITTATIKCTKVKRVGIMCLVVSYFCVTNYRGWLVIIQEKCKQTKLKHGFIISPITLGLVQTNRQTKRFKEKQT